MIQRLLFWIIVIHQTVQSFLQLPRHYNPASSLNYLEDPSSVKLHCICINCKYVTNCKAYHFVEEKHQQPHICEKPTFTPRDGSPGIEVHIRTNSQKTKEVADQITSEHKLEEQKAMENSNAGGDLIGEAIYDMSGSVELEYDVVECEDFVEDKGCWVRNMPEEIRLANPDFVPP
mmetsp:Transcript_27863/g.41119  ORF Transcript_27863/g.41119 Transcript_27863/m.41119 type:complete len:175 (-) Transcript_27863:321-845(-)|eukprot:CAMPEP_0194219802 /NCGR_PEP_ID=MMETSP0156-20130528/26884_1 /TAXON_ID=33649 /ORGANISM="Thalassionema nitzschioides, Strain L26-B" /LENGTH=174 /DNA_ID=CAMNT_0038949597 /DNA_START=29 /DNA_END=553 /DNA_ORIENTATION=+